MTSRKLHDKPKQYRMILRRHARRRALERYGLEFTWKVLQEIRAAIIETIPIRVSPDGKRGIFDVTVRGVPVRVVYYFKMGEVVTFLRKDQELFEDEDDKTGSRCAWGEAHSGTTR